MGLVGLRLRVAGSGQGFSLAIRGDAGLSRLTTSDGASGSGAGVSGGLEGRAFRLRAGAETRLRLRLGGGSAIEPFAAVSARADGETEVEGRGLEVSGGLRLTAGSRFRLEAQGRMLAAYSEEGFRERGAGVTALLQSKASGEGLSFSLAPTWGGRGRQDALWRPDAALLAGRRFDRRTEGGRFEARFGYGLPAGPLPGVFTPFGDYGAGDGRNRMRLGVRYGDPLSRAAAPSTSSWPANAAPTDTAHGHRPRTPPGRPPRPPRHAPLLAPRGESPRPPHAPAGPARRAGELCIAERNCV